MIYWTFLYHDLTNSRNVDCMPMGVCEICILILLTLKKLHYFIVSGVFYGTYTVLWFNIHLEKNSILKYFVFHDKDHNLCKISSAVFSHEIEKMQVQNVNTWCY